MFTLHSENLKNTHLLKKDQKYHLKKLGSKKIAHAFGIKYNRFLGNFIFYLTPLKIYLKETKKT